MVSMDLVADHRRIFGDAEIGALDRALAVETDRIGLVDRVHARADEMRLAASPAW